MIAPQGKKIDPAGLGPPAEARNRRKATVTKRRNTAPGFYTPDPKIVIIFWEKLIFC